MVDVSTVVGVDDIAKLNAIVTSKTIEMLKEGSTLSPEVDAVATDKRVVYKNRFTWFPPLLISICISNLYYLSITGEYSMVATVLLMNFIYYDFFSGVLHIVLDNPNFIKIPLFDESCLEFQWHHHIPTDIISKSYFEVCGDLNAIIVISFVLLFNPFYGLSPRTKLAFGVVSAKLLMAYFGQYCHRMSHTPTHKRPGYVIFLQDNGLMISAAQHGIHHQTYNDNFCIGSGIFNPFFTTVLKSGLVHEYFWLILFVSMLFFDVVGMIKFLTYMGFTGYPELY